MKKKTIGFIIAGVLLIGGCSSIGNNNSDIDKTISELEQTLEVKEKIETLQEETKTSYTLSQENAIKKAKNYLDFMGFSKTGLISQLEYEGFSREDATFAVDNIIVDWNEQAAKKAQSYLDTMSFSRQGLMDQLEYEGFTSSEIEYGVTAVGY